VKIKIGYLVDELADHAVPRSVLVLAAVLVIRHLVDLVAEIHLGSDLIENVYAEALQLAVFLDYVWLFLLKKRENRVLDSFSYVYTLKKY
jgi:hypothetical protein